VGNVINKRRHRILLDVTFKHGHIYGNAVDVFMWAIQSIDLSEVQLVRPLNTKKVFEATKRTLNDEIRLDLETAMDALREARHKL
jgi:hypothetical protein